MTDKEIIDCSNERLFSIYDKKGLICLSDNIYKYRGIPYINSPVADIGPTPFGNPISYYYQNLYDRRYCMFVTCCYEKVYNYWDRIGDLIHSFFPTLLPIKSVDFSRIIGSLQANREADPDFLCLKAIKEREYKELNEFRKDVIHYYQYESSNRYEHNVNTADLEVIGSLWNKKKRFPEYFKEHLRLACDGYYHTHRFLTKVAAEKKQGIEQIVKLLKTSPTK